MNDESRTALIAHLRGDEYSGKSAEESHLYFHSPHSATSTTTRLKTVTTAMLFGVLSQASVSKVIKWNNLGLMIQNIREQNREGIGMLIQGLALANEITANEAAAGLAMLGETESITTETMQDAPIVRVLNPIADEGRPNVIDFDEFKECYAKARG